MRIIDANINRLREALRVIEDYYRLGRNDQATSAILYRMRHEVAELSRHIHPEAARDSFQDIGRGRHDTAPKELKDIIIANLKRAQEAARTLEEYCKTCHPHSSPQWQEMRFSLYDLETKFNVRRLIDRELYLIITPKYCRESPEGIAQKACEAGIEVIQYREKNRGQHETLETARELRRMTRDNGVTFLINDRIDIALLAEADGVHLGQADLPVSEARLLLGPGRIIGLSTHNKAELHEGLACCADYLAFGPVFSGIHKEREEPIVGLDGLSAIPTTAESKPVFVNGGLNEHNVHEIFSRGLKRVVFMTALTLSEDLAAAVHTIKTLREHT